MHASSCLRNPGTEEDAPPEGAEAGVPWRRLDSGARSLHASYNICFTAFPAKARDVVAAKDFGFSAFNVVMDRCQQRALQQPDMFVPDPARQLELLSMRRERGKRGGPARLSLTPKLRCMLPSASAITKR